MTLAASITGNGVTLHLNNSSGVATIGGAPNAAATTPFIVVDEQYTIQAPNPEPLWSGGPPLRDGSSLLDQSYPNGSDSIVVACYGSSPDNLASLIRQLDQLLLATTPIVFSIQPNGTTSPLVTEIYTATAQPVTNYHVQPLRGSSTAVLRISFVRYPHFGRLSSGETLINAVSLTNSGSGNANVTAFSSGAGDLIYAGGPVNYTASGFTTNPAELWLASIAAHAYVSSSGTFSSTSTTPVGVGTPTNSISATSIKPDNRLRIRIILRLTSASANLRVGCRVVADWSDNSSILYQSPYVAPLSSSATGTLVDLGYFSGDYFRQNNATAGTFAVVVYYYSSDGAATSGAVASFEALFYYDLCKFYRSVSPGSAQFDTLNSTSFREVTGSAALPVIPDGVRMRVSGIDKSGHVRGRPPRYVSGASLWAAWMSGGIHNNTHTATFSATHGPLYAVGRGAG